MACAAQPGNSAASQDEYLRKGIALYKKAEKDYNKRDLYDAVVNLSWALKKQPRNGEAYRYRGSAFALLGYMRMAHADLHKAVFLEPNYHKAWNDLGAVHYMMEYMRDAMKEFNKALAIDPKFAEAHRHKGEVLSHYGKTAEALESCSKAIALDPSDAENFCARAEVFIGVMQWEKAVQDCTEAISLNPRSRNAWYYRGTCYIHLNRDKDAVADFDRAIAIDPEYAACYANRAVSLHKLGRTREAERDLNTALKLNPRDATSLDHRGYLREEQGKHSEAIADYNASLEISPDPYTYHHRAKAKAARGFSKGALDDWDLALKLAPEFEDAYLARQAAVVDLSRYEKILSKLDRETQAIASEGSPEDDLIAGLTRELKSDPASKQALYRRACAFMASGEFANASKDFRAYIGSHGWKDERSVWCATMGHIALRHLQDEKAASDLIKTASRQAKMSPWAAKVLQYLDHQISAEALLRQAADKTERTTAEYFIGTSLSLSGLKEPARRHLTNVQIRGDSSIPTYRAALRELNELEKSRR